MPYANHNPISQPQPYTIPKQLTKETKATISVLFFIPAFVSPFLPTVLAKFVFLIDVIFSYLYVHSGHACMLVSMVLAFRGTDMLT